MQFFKLDLLLAARTRRVNDRQHNKGAEHIQDQRGNDVFRVEHTHISADDGERHRRHRGGRHGEQAAGREIAEHAFIGNKVL